MKNQPWIPCAGAWRQKGSIGLRWIGLISLAQNAIGLGQKAVRFVNWLSKEEWEEKHGYGTATKCDYCMDRVKEGREPACVEACPAKARHFGDIDDPESEVSILIRRERGFQLNPEFGTDPSCYYLPPR